MLGMLFIRDLKPALKKIKRFGYFKGLLNILLTSLRFVILLFLLIFFSY